MASTTEAAPRVDKRRAILDAAGPAFGESGYERASVEAIAAAARVSKPTVYSYFGGKEELFRQTMADIARQVNEASYDAVVALDVTSPAWERSLRDVALALTQCQRDGCAGALMRLVLAESRRDPEVYDLVRRTGFEPIRETLAGRLAMLANAGKLELVDPELAAQHFIALTQAELPELTACGSADPGDDIVAAAVDRGVDAFLRAYVRR